jgi:hypothetical protein
VGVRREEIFAEDDPTLKPTTFYDPRATGITWMALGRPLKIKQRAGHRRFEPTEGYHREAENLRAGIPACRSRRCPHRCSAASRAVLARFSPWLRACHFRSQKLGVC